MNDNIINTPYVKTLLYLGVFLLFIIPIKPVFAYNINVQIDDCNNTMLYLGMYYGAEHQIIDSAITNNYGFAQFQSKKALLQGIYFIAIPPYARFEILIEDDQDFEINTNLNHLLDSLTVSKLDYTDYFIPFQYEIAKLNLEQTQIKMQKQFYEQIGLIDSVKMLSNKLDVLNYKRTDVYNNYLAKDSLNFLSKMIKMMLPPNFDKDIIALKYANPPAYFKYFKDHYFDRVDFSDSRILRTPEFVFYRLLNEYCIYFFNTNVSNINEVFEDVDNFITKTSVNSEVSRYVISFLTSYYANPPTMGMDAVFVHLVDEYYAKNKLDWADESMIDAISDEADAIRYNLIGNTAIDVQLTDRSGGVSSLLQLDADYTVLWFWEPGCEKCELQTPILEDIYPQLLEKNIEVIAIYIGTDKNAWLSYISNLEANWVNLYDPLQTSGIFKYYGASRTPRLFILDKNKQILARDVFPENLLQYFYYLENR